MRKAVQIAVIDGPGALTEVLYALCDDGTIWRTLAGPGAKAKGAKHQWQPVEEIPSEPASSEVK
jgi:hypothetical protein